VTFISIPTLLTAIIVILILLLSVSLFYLIKFGLIIIRVQDVVEDSLDIMDEKYSSISSILKIPLFYDSNEVRSVLEDVRDVRESILSIARALTSVDGELDRSVNDVSNESSVQGNKEIGRKEKTD
jgi:hypothetical protein